MSTEPQVSVVMPSYQSAEHIRGALHALETQETSASCEIIVVDSSSDGTHLIVQREFPRVRLIHFPERRQAGTARNIGIAAAHGTAILFIDSDTIPCATWIEQMWEALKNGADGICGGMSNGTPWSITGSSGFYLEFFRFLTHGGPPEPACFLVSGNSGFRREILTGIQYSDRSAGEDFLFSLQLFKSGRRLLFVPAASVAHQNRTGLRRLLRHQRRLGVGAHFYRSHHSPTAIRLFRALPRLVFLMPFGVMLWIGWTIVWRRRLGDLLRFGATLPLSLVANAAWAMGFYGALRDVEREVASV
jgi:cellulose synthase/poly-beta-1,6-N-acetylglucosamine synthase-like glycosyltransferase